MTSFNLFIIIICCCNKKVFFMMFVLLMCFSVSLRHRCYYEVGGNDDGYPPRHYLWLWLRMTWRSMSAWAKLWRLSFRLSAASSHLNYITNSINTEFFGVDWLSDSFFLFFCLLSAVGFSLFVCLFVCCRACALLPCLTL